MILEPYKIVLNGICPTGYSPLSSETECKALAGKTISNAVIGSFGFSGCLAQWTPPQTCFVYQYGTHIWYPYFVNKECGQTSNYATHHLVCKKGNPFITPTTWLLDNTFYNFSSIYFDNSSKDTF